MQFGFFLLALLSRSRNVIDEENQVIINDGRDSDPLEQHIQDMTKQVDQLREKDRLDRYIGDLEALREGQVHQELTSQLIAMGIEPKTGLVMPPEDILKRYRSIPLHAIVLYTSEDQDVASYISKHWGALHTLSGDFCDIYLSISQFKNAEDAYDFIEKLDIVQQSNFRAYSQLPGLFFWDNDGITEYISFGPDVNSTSIRRVLRTVFEQIRLLPNIASIMYARELMDQQFWLILGSKNEQLVRRDPMSYTDFNALLAVLDNSDCLIAAQVYMKQVQRALDFASSLFHRGDKIWQAECRRANTHLRQMGGPVLPGDPLTYSMNEISLGNLLHGIHKKVNQLIRLVDDFCLDCETQTAQTYIKLERVLIVLDHDLPEVTNLTTLLSARLQQLQLVNTDNTEETGKQPEKHEILPLEHLEVDVNKRRSYLQSEIPHQEQLLKAQVVNRRRIQTIAVKNGYANVDINFRLEDVQEAEKQTEALLADLRQQLANLDEESK